MSLIALLFHELAHQVVYVKDDSGFNESFATAVEEIGVERWLESRGESQRMAEYQETRDLRQRVSQQVMRARDELSELFGSDIDEATMRQRKADKLRELADTIAAIQQAVGREPSSWFSGEMNNAKLISTALYEGQLPQFRALYSDCAQQLPCFYSAARELAELDSDTRAEALAARDLRSSRSNNL